MNMGERREENKSTKQIEKRKKGARDESTKEFLVEF
jgi:hypothetical protein